MNNSDLMLGSKYFRYIENDEIEIVRIYKSNGLEVKVYIDGDKNNTLKLTAEQLQKDYMRLNPHAIVNFCIAKVGNNLDDVIVTMHKMSDLMSNEPTPYCVCRQNITDVFANQIKISNKMYVGCSMSLETCPPDIDYRMMIACNGLDKCINVASYMDDTLDDLLHMVKTKDFDRTLESLFIDHINYTVKDVPTIAAMKSRMLKLDKYDGYCKTLKTLLEDNNFMYDFYRAFGILPIDVKVNYDEETGVVSDDIIEILSNINNVNITSTLCMEYWYDIKLDEIDNDYMLIMDKDNKLYVIAYVAGGQRHINIEAVESEENIERLANSTLGENKSIKEAMDHIRINKNKYN